MPLVQLIGTLNKNLMQYYSQANISRTLQQNDSLTSLDIVTDATGQKSLYCSFTEQQQYRIQKHT